MLAWWFVWNRPAEAPRFVRRHASRPTPEWNELELAHEKALGGTDQQLRDWRKKVLNKLAHVDRMSAGHVWNTEAVELRFAPEFDRELLIAATGLFCEVIPFLLECVEFMRRKYNLQPANPEGAVEYHARLQAWIAAIPDPLPELDE